MEYMPSNNTKKKHRKRSHTKTNKSKISQKEANRIVQRLHPYSSEKALLEFQTLRKKMTCPKAKRAAPRTTLGNNIVDTFTLIERLHAKGEQNISFYEFWKQRAEFKKKPYVKKMLEFYETRNIDEIRKLRYIYNLYFSAITIFRPVMAMELYCRVNARRVLDFTMGWGGRLVGACALNLDAYYGIDLNTHLREPYNKMVETLKKAPEMKTNIHLYFQDALTVDYSKMDYDTVFTSPPYYDMEIYRGKKQYNHTEEDWNTRFYIPIIRTTFSHLKQNGQYCLNVPEKIYTTVCIGILGKCTRKILLKKGERKQGESYKEYIYIWKKDSK